MVKLTVGVIAISLAFSAAHSQSSARKPTQTIAPKQSANAPSMPSEEEIGDLVGKASEYVETYKQTFKNAKHSLDKAPNPGFNEKAIELCAQAWSTIAAIRKNGSSAVALVGLIGILDDMSLNASRASASVMLVAMEEDKSKPSSHAMQDFQDLAQAEKNCYDISELILHATLRYISVEENALGVLLDQQKHK